MSCHDEGAIAADASAVRRTEKQIPRALTRARDDNM
jgi:hypothetical protein